MKRIEQIILHCSDSLWGSAAEIRKWHLNNGWKDIGYHFVIGNGYSRPKFYIPGYNGSLEIGRYLDEDDKISDQEIGAHTLGFNATSVGICFIGKDKFTEQQFWQGKKLVEFLLTRYGMIPANVYGHYEKQKGKTCPGFDMNWFRGTLFRCEFEESFNLKKYWEKTA